MAPTSLLLGGRYRLDRLLASGDITEVWEGTDEVLARPVAVKVLQPQRAAEPGAADRFRRDAVAAARLVHPGIVGVYDARVEGADAFVVMELVRGTDVARLLADRGGRLSPRLAAGIAADVAEALDHAHRAGVVHRDVKPGNILCDGQRAKVADFGIGPASTASPYVAPEVAADGPVDARADVFSLGVVLYEMVCGRRPAVPTPLRPRQIVAGVPRDLEAVILRAIDTDAARRFPSAGELRAALLSVDLDDDAVPLVGRDDTPPAGLVPSFRQSERSWLVPAAAIVLVAAALVVAGVLFARTDVGRDLFRGGDGRTPGSASAAPPRAIDATVQAYDPLGDGAEHDDEAVLVTDGNPETTWATSSYSRAAFGGLKAGVGLVAQLDEVTPIRRVEVQSPAPGWRAEVYVASAPSTAFPGGWGAPVVTLDGTRELVTADLPDGLRGGAVLVWLTSLPRDGAGFRAVIGELRLLG